MRCVSRLALLLLFGCSGASPEREEVLQTMKAKAEEVGRAIVAGDQKTVVDLTHPKVVQMMGSRDGMIILLERTAREMKSRRTFIRSVEFEEPVDMQGWGDELFGVVPFTLEMALGDRRAMQKSYLIGVSSDGGKTWTFVDGAQADRAMVQRLFPNFPNKLRLPERQEPVEIN